MVLERVAPVEVGVGAAVVSPAWTGMRNTSPVGAMHQLKYLADWRFKGRVSNGLQLCAMPVAVGVGVRRDGARDAKLRGPCLAVSRLCQYCVSKGEISEHTALSREGDIRKRL